MIIIKVNHEHVLKIRTMSTVNVILSQILRISSEELISDLFVYTENEIVMTLIKRFESILIKASIKPTFLKNNLHNFYVENANFLKENNLYQEFADFSYFIYSNLEHDNIRFQTLLAYKSLLLQQFCYLAPPGKIIYGVTSNGEPMITDEKYPFLDYPLYEIENKRNKSIELLMETYKKYGYSIMSMEELDRITADDRLITNMTLEMCGFIDENTKDIFPLNLYNPSFGIKTLRIWKNTHFYKNLLKRRRYNLPSDGVLGFYKNAGDIKSIFLKELFKDNQIYLLYQINVKNDEGLFGVYDTKNDFFYSAYRDSTGEAIYHNFIENFILENYCHLTTDIDIDKKRNMALKVVDNIEKGTFYYPNQPIVQFVYKDNKTKTSYKKEKKFRNYDKKKYKEETITINPYIRKLPIGASVSSDAIQRAKEFGYELSEGETFVRPFSRKTFKLKE